MLTKNTTNTMKKILTTKNGTDLFFTGTTFYTSNEEDVRNAINKDLQSANPLDRMMAEQLASELAIYGLVGEVN